MIANKNIFLEKKILIYGLGKSGLSSYKFLNNKAKVYLFDDNLSKKFKNQTNQRLKRRYSHLPIATHGCCEGSGGRFNQFL